MTSTARRPGFASMLVRCKYVMMMMMMVMMMTTCDKFLWVSRVGVFVLVQRLSSGPVSQCVELRWNCQRAVSGWHTSRAGHYETSVFTHGPTTVTPGCVTGQATRLGKRSCEFVKHLWDVVLIVTMLSSWMKEKSYRIPAYTPVVV